MQTPHRILVHIAFIIVAFISIAVSVLAQGPGDLLVTPTRIVFEGNKKNEVLTLVNRGNDSAIYEIVVVQYRMTKDGTLEQIETPDPGQLFATELIRFFPRRVTLAPKEAQNVRLQLRLSADLATGEYRSHLYFRAVPKDQALAPSSADTSIGQQEFSVKLTALFGVSIPIIVRNGTLEASVSLNNVKLQQENPQSFSPSLAVTFNRTGTQSVYGDISVKFVSATGIETIVGSLNGVSVYTPNNERTLRMPLTIPEGLTLKNGMLKVEYTSRSDVGAGPTLATSELAIP